MLSCSGCAGAGKALRWRTAACAGAFQHTAAVRVDSGVSEGDAVGTNYDPMIAKIVTHAADRASALHLLREALADTQVSHQHVMKHDAAVLGKCPGKSYS